MSISDVHSFGVNFAIGGESMRALLNRINQSSIHRAGACVLLTGINDLANTSYYPSFQNAADTVIYMHQHQLEPAMTGKWVVVKILPVVDGICTVPNWAVNAVNSFMQTKYGNRQNTVLVDVTAQLAPQGQLAYHIGDGVHLNAGGYAILKSAISSALTTLL